MPFQEVAFTKELTGYKNASSERHKGSELQPDTVALRSAEWSTSTITWRSSSKDYDTDEINSTTLV